MVAIGYFAISCAAFTAVIHDRSRPDLFTGFLAALAGIMSTLMLLRRRGRELAAAWGCALTNLVGLATVSLFYQLGHFRLHGDTMTDLRGMFALMFVPPMIAAIAGNIGYWVARKRADRRQSSRSEPE